MNDKQFKEIIKKLDLIARLLALSLPEKITQPEKIEIFSSIGLQPKEIALILGITPNTVSIALHRIKNKGKKSKEKKDE